MGPRIPVVRRFPRCAQALVRRPQGHSRPCACIQPQALAPARAQQRSGDCSRSDRSGPGAAVHCGRTARAAVHGLVRGLRPPPRRPQPVSGGSPAPRARCPRRARAAQTLEPAGISAGRVGQRGAGRCLLRASLSCSSAAVPITFGVCEGERLRRASCLPKKIRWVGPSWLTEKSAFSEKNSVICRGTGTN